MTPPAMDLREQQFAFAAHLRDPQGAPAPEGIEERRLAVYRELFFNNVEGLLRGNFPVIHKLLGETRWKQLARDFYREHRCATPLFPQIAQEFIAYLQARQERGNGDPPFLVELAHYEWVELALSLAEDELSSVECDPDGDLLDGIPVPSPLAWPLAYAWPVQRLSADFQPESPPDSPTFLLVLRDASDKVRFSAIDAFGYALLHALSNNAEQRCGRELLAAMAREHGIDGTEAFIANGARLLQQLRERDAILGTKRGVSRNPAA